MLWRRRILMLLINLLPPAMWMTFYFKSSINTSFISFVLAVGLPLALYGTLGLFVQARLKRRWEASDRGKATSDKRQFILVLRPFVSPLVERRPGSLHKSEGTIVNDFCRRLQALANFSVVCIGDGQVLSGYREPSEFVRIEPTHDKWLAVFAILAERCVAIIVIPEATNGCISELKLLSQFPGVLRRTLVWMPREQRRRIVATRWEATRLALIQYGFKLPPYDARGLMYRPKTDFSVDVVSTSARRPEDTAVKELSNMVVPPARPGLGEALKELDANGFQW